MGGLHGITGEWTAALGALPFGVTLHDAEGETIACNSAAASILGLEPHELLGSDPWSPEAAVRYEDGTPVRPGSHPVRQAATGREPLTGLQLEVQVGGVSKCIEVDFAPAPELSRAAVVAMIRPAPAPKAWLSDFARRFTAVLDRESVAVWVKDLSGRYIFVSRGFSESLGLRRCDMIGKRDPELLPAALAARCAESDRLALKARDVIEVDEKLEASEGGGDRSHIFRTVKIPVLDDDGEPQVLAGISMDITDLRDREDALARIAHEDELTGLSNRRLFDEHLDLALARAQRDERHAAVLFVDVDGLKAVNDRFSHSAGDHVLRTVAKRLTGATRASDAIARLDAAPPMVARRGGDEFAVLLADLTGDPYAAVATVVRRIDEEVSGDLEIDGEQIGVSVSIGVALFPTDGSSADDLLEKASATMSSGREHRRALAGDLEPLSLPAPPGLAEALGYPGNARRVAFLWHPERGRLVWSDGHLTGAGLSRAWRVFVQAACTRGSPLADIASRRATDQRSLIVDRLEGKLSAATPAATSRVLEGNVRPVAHDRLALSQLLLPHDLSREGLDAAALTERLADELKGEFDTLLQRDEQRLKGLASWLQDAAARDDT